MRLPKRGFSNAPFSREFATVTLGNITANLKKAQLCRGVYFCRVTIREKQRLPIKILFTDGSSEGLTFNGISKFTKRN